MKKFFTLNNKKVEALEFDYNLICDLEELGFNIDDLSEKPMSALRGYIACCLEVDLKTAGKEISKHIASGETLDEATEVLTEKMQNSDFFQGQQANTKTESSTGKTPKK